MLKSSADLLLRIVDEAFDRKSWHGTNLRGAIRGLKAEDVVWRPHPRRHNIWELVVHAAYWKYTVWRRLVGEKRGSFPLKGSNWFTRPQPGTDLEAHWKSDVALLVTTHRRLREAVVRFTLDDHGKADRSGPASILSLITGVAAHDLYHAGQIQLLKRWQADSAESPKRD